jgi:hypothetical protein
MPTDGCRGLFRCPDGTNICIVMVLVFWYYRQVIGRQNAMMLLGFGVGAADLL